MNKIRNYVDLLFSEIPRSKKAIELKEEMLSNLTERFNDYIAEGKSENQAYSLVIANIGDVDAILAEVSVAEPYGEKADYYRKRRAINISLAVILFILSPFIPMLIIELRPFFFLDDYANEIIGGLSMFVLISLGVGLLIYTKLSTPPEYSTKKAPKPVAPIETVFVGEKAVQFKRFISLYWLVVVLAFFVMVFFTNIPNSWFIWPIAGILSAIIKVIFEIINGSDIK